MSSPYRPQGSDRPQGSADDPTVSYDGGSADETQVVRPPAGGYGATSSTPDLHKGAGDAEVAPTAAGMSAAGTSASSDERPDPFSPMPAVPRDSPRYGGEQASSWSAAYADDRAADRASDRPDTKRAEPDRAPGDRFDDDRFDDGRSAGPSVTSVYPQSTPEYAPAGYPSAYAPATVVPPPASAAIPEKPSSRVGPGFLSALIGLILAASGTYLLVRFGFRAGVELAKGNVSIRNSILGLLGALLLFAATVLNGWSPWSTLLPGIVLTGVGGWALFDANAFRRVGDWLRSVLDAGEVTNALITGFLLALGLVLLGASIATLLARSGGKRDGRILGRRDAPAA